MFPSDIFGLPFAFEQVSVIARAYDQAGAGNYAIIDDVIVTQDES